MGAGAVDSGRDVSRQLSLLLSSGIQSITPNHSNSDSFTPELFSAISDTRDRKVLIVAILLAIVIVRQIVLAFVLYAKDGNLLVRNIGWGYPIAVSDFRMAVNVHLQITGRRV